MLVYTKAQIASYLESDATHFLQYGVVDVTVGSFQAVSGHGFATVEIFRFPDFVKAFGAYSTRRIAVQKFLELQNEAFAGRNSVHLWRGPFYVRITGRGDETASLEKLAGTVADRMPVAPQRPAVFGFFPDRFRVAHTETFTADPAWGQPQMRNAFTATFDLGGTQIEGLIIPTENRGAATKALESFRAFFVTNGRLLDPLPNLGEENFTGEDKMFGRVAAFRIDRFVIAYKGFGQRQQLVDLSVETAQRILNTIRKQLESSDEARAPQQPAVTSTAPPWMAP